MNRHKSNWSAMHDMNNEQTQMNNDYKEFKEYIRKFSNKYSFDEAVTIIRRIYKEMNKC